LLTDFAIRIVTQVNHLSRRLLSPRIADLPLDGVKDIHYELKFDMLIGILLCNYTRNVAFIKFVTGKAHTPDKTNYKPRFLTDKLFKNEMSPTLRMLGTLNDEY